MCLLLLSAPDPVCKEGAMTLLLSPQSSWFVSLLLTTTLSGNNQTFLATQVSLSHGVTTLGSTQILQFPPVMVGLIINLTQPTAI